jgi:hypothetical protein
MKKLILSFSGTVLALILCLLPFGLVLADPGITLDLAISLDGGGSWEDAATEPGAITTEGDSILYQYTISNTGDVAFTYTLSDSSGELGTGTLDPLVPPITLTSTAQTALSYQQSYSASVEATGMDLQANPFSITDDDTVYYYGIPLTIDVMIDIKPGSEPDEPNSINLHSQGVTPVALLSSAGEFDATAIDGSAITFAGASPAHWAIEDVNGDGLDDMILHFRTQELELDENSTEATLNINSFDEVANQDVTSYSGTDSVNIVPEGNAFGHANDNGGSNGNAYGHDNSNGQGNAYGHNK